VTEDPLGEGARPLSAEEVEELKRLWVEALRSPVPEYSNAALVRAFLEKRG
jgi:hypothetical protein